MRGIKTLLSSTAVALALTALPSPTANAQVAISIGGPPPVCQYGYYPTPPYGCAPVGYYGPGYFYNGIFLGVGPWAGWGYAHGWGSHRFVSDGGGRYHGNEGFRANHSSYARNVNVHNTTVHNTTVRNNNVRNDHHAVPARSNQGRSAPSHAPANHATAHAAPRPAAAHSAPHAAASHGGGESHGGGGGSHGARR